MDSLHQPGANGDEPDPAKSPGPDPILPEPEMSPAGGPEPPAKSRERGSSADVLAGDGERSPDDIGEDEDIVRARAPCWAGRISLIDSDPEKLGILYGFARKLINEAAQAGVVLEAEAEDLAHTAIRRALEGRLRRRKANAPPATAARRQTSTPAMRSIRWASRYPFSARRSATSYGTRWRPCAGADRAP